MVVARRASPVDIVGRLAVDEATVLPEIFAGTGAAASVQSMDHRRGDASRLQNKPRHAGGELAALADRRMERLLFGIALPEVGHSLSDARLEPRDNIANGFALGARRK